MQSDSTPRAAASFWRGPALYLVIAGLLILRVVYAFVLKINSDEPQHLHVVWEWTQGLLPYRDFFDNHTPLFHMMYAPLLALIGERADIIPLMRLGMLPLYFASLWITWSIGRRLWGRDIALAGCALTALFPAYFELSLQFRTDNLWALAWLATIFVLVSGRLDLRRGFFVGLLVGTTFAISMKSVLLVGTGLISALIVFVMLGLTQRNWRALLPLRALAGIVLGVLVVPAILLIWFAEQGAWDSMMYCLFGHNMVAELGRWEDGFAKLLIGPITLPLALWLVWRSRDRREDSAVWARRTFVLLAAFGYLASFYGYWPLFTRQGLLPVVPFVGLALAALLVPLMRNRNTTQRSAMRWILPVLLVVELALIVKGDAGTKSIPVAVHREKLERILALAKPGEFVMDAKGESVFRQRPIYWVLEGITLERMRNGSIVDDIPEKLTETATKIVVDDRLPERAREFVRRNYLKIDTNITIAGQMLQIDTDGDSARFTIEIEGDYIVVGNAQIAEGRLDGSALQGVRHLARGEHVFESARAGTFALVWAPALERGVSAAMLFAQADR